MRRHTRPAAGLFLLIVLVALAFGCRQEVPPLYRRNQPPETTLTVVPEDSAQAFYRYHVYWRGSDSDGRVVRYMFAITDTLSRDEGENWNPEIAEDRDKGVYTTKTDSVFTFNSSRGRQSFNITAIDDYGRRDPTPARAFFRIVDNGLPRVQFLDVQGFRPGTTLPSCEGDSCIVPMFTNFKIRVTGTTGNNRITGIQWQSIRPGEVTPEAFQPYGADSLFLATGRDTMGFADNGVDTLWALHGTVLSAYYYSTRTDSVPPGSFIFRARVRDEARLTSLLSTGTKRVKVNYDPQTHLARIPACDCPKPPPNCASQDSIVAGWSVGIDQTGYPDSTQWVRFCDGDTLPILSWVRFYAQGADDSRDVPIDPAGAREVGYSARFEWHAGTPPYEIVNGNMPFSNEYEAASYLLPPPYNTPWRGIRNGWGDAQRFPGLCPFDFTYYVAAVDEHGTRDGSPDHIRFYLSGSPIIDSLSVPPVIVLVPKCKPGFDPFCPNFAGMAPFGPDTVAVVGQWIQDTSGISILGLNKYRMALQAFGHDWPGDSNPLIDPGRQGRILSWRYDFNCTSPGCSDLAVPGEGQWRLDSQAINVFDDTLQVTFPLDTLRTTSGFVPYMAVLPTENLGAYDFQILGRDTDPIGGTCVEPSDLGSNPSEFPRATSETGRLTQVENRPTVLLQLQDVRPYVPRALAARQQTAKKGWWRR
jgi:hypothetical protein